MRITSKGQVTIPQEIRDRLGLLPHTEVEFQVIGEQARIAKVQRTAEGRSRGGRALEALRGTADAGMTTDQIMALTRPRERPKSRD